MNSEAYHLTDEQLADLVPQTALVLERQGERNMVCMTRAELHEFARAVRAAGVDADIVPGSTEERRDMGMQSAGLSGVRPNRKSEE